MGERGRGILMYYRRDWGNPSRRTNAFFGWDSNRMHVRIVTSRANLPGIIHGGGGGDSSGSSNLGGGAV